MKQRIIDWCLERKFTILRLVLTCQFCWFILTVHNCLKYPYYLPAVLNVCINIFGVWIEFRILDKWKREALQLLRLKEAELAALEQLYKALVDFQDTVKEFHKRLFPPASKN